MPSSFPYIQQSLSTRNTGGSGGIDAMSVNSDDILLPDNEDRVMKFFLNIP